MSVYTRLTKEELEQLLNDYDIGDPIDIEGINDRTFTENVVELMASQLQKLPKLSRDVLSIAACLGAEFDLQTLTWAETKSAKEIFYSLQICLNYNLILPKSKSDKNLMIQSFKFSQDSIQ